MLKKIFSFFVLLILSHQSVAHEFWLEPLNFKIDVTDKLRAHEKVGQDFKGNAYVYLSTSYRFLRLTQGENTIDVKSRLGDLPAVSEDVKEQGLVVLSTETTSSNVTYEKWQKFESFIKNKGLDWVLKRHKERKLSDHDFVESYRRYAKSLIKVGHGKGADRVQGLGFEWVVETNPYTSSDKTITAQLLWKGKPHAQAYVSVFNKFKGALIKTELTTNSEGRVEIPRAKGGEFLINAVQMVEASEEVAKESGAVWESHWASVTYAF